MTATRRLAAILAVDRRQLLAPDGRGRGGDGEARLELTICAAAVSTPPVGYCARD